MCAFQTRSFTRQLFSGCVTGSELLPVSFIVPELVPGADATTAVSCCLCSSALWSLMQQCITNMHQQWLRAASSPGFSPLAVFAPWVMYSWPQ
jgi:hypothetical protein